MDAVYGQPSAPIPATVAILTYNSMATLAETLMSVREFADVLVCDGGSTDGTREFAHMFGARLIDQGDEYTDEAGRLINMTGVRQQMISAAQHSWVFVIDHDEIATPELRNEVRTVVGGATSHGGYDVPRQYVLGGTVIDCASTYPSYQTRLVRREALQGYEGIIHDRPVFRDGFSVGRLSASMLIPQPLLRELWPKWMGYMRLEEVGKLDLTYGEWYRGVLVPEARMIRWLVYRILKIRSSCAGTRLPLAYEISRIGYELGVVWYTGRRFLGVRPGNVHQAWK